MMKIIPVVKVHKLLTFGKRFDRSRVDMFMDALDEKILYLIDEIGIKKNNPQVNVYQQLASTYELWVDSGPRDSGDVVDLVFSGVKTIVIRPSLWQEIDMKNVRSMTDHPLLGLQEVIVEDRRSIDDSLSLIGFYDGMIVSIIGEWNQRRFKNEEAVKSIATRDESYVYESAGLNKKTWEHYGFTGMLVDNEFINEVR